MPEVDDDQLAALRRLRAVFGSMEVVEVISHDPAVAPDESIEGEDGGPAADAPEEEAQAHALLTRAVSGPNWRAGGRGTPRQSGATADPM